ncbi:hypothetical protein J6590_007058, partial [Homalodisca vitripennis]
MPGVGQRSSEPDVVVCYLLFIKHAIDDVSFTVMTGPRTHSGAELPAPKLRQLEPKKPGLSFNCTLNLIIWADL